MRQLTILSLPSPFSAEGPAAAAKDDPGGFRMVIRSIWNRITGDYSDRNRHIVHRFA